jgi:MFS transporter, LPLT family, lysophospholipid transporter
MNRPRNYLLLLISQFLGAFGDNCILAVILGPVMKRFQAGEITGSEQSIANIYYTSLLFVPYLVCAPLAGYFNDRYPKTHALILGNGLKVLGAFLAWISLAHEQWWLSIGYFVVGIGACIYSPAKYGILPEILPLERLVKANGTVEMLTLMAILCGNIVGARLVDTLSLPVCYTIVIGIYATSTILNLFMTRTPAYPDTRFAPSLQEFCHTLLDLVRRPRLLKILIGTSLFWVCGAMMKMNFQPWGQQVMGFTTMTQVALLGLWLSIGVIVGSMLAGQLHKIGDLHATRRYGLLLAVAIAAVASTHYLIKAGFTHGHGYSIAMLLLAGFAAGLFLIPLNAALQAEAHQGKLGKTLATQNLLENIAMLSGSTFAWFNVSIGFDPTQLFLALAVLVALVAANLAFPKTLPPVAHSPANPA